MSSAPNLVLTPGATVALIGAARERIQDSLHKAKVKLAEAEDIIVQRGKQAARVTDSASSSMMTIRSGFISMSKP